MFQKLKDILTSYSDQGYEIEEDTTDKGTRMFKIKGPDFYNEVLHQPGNSKDQDMVMDLRLQDDV